MWFLIFFFSFNFSYDAVGSKNFFILDIIDMNLPDLMKAVTPHVLPQALDSSAIRIGFRTLNPTLCLNLSLSRLTEMAHSLYIDLEPSSLKFEFNADFYITALEGQVEAVVDVTSGVMFGAAMTPVNILGLVQIE